MLTTTYRDEVPDTLTSHLASFVNAAYSEHDRIARRIHDEAPNLMTVMNLTGNGLASAAARFKFGRELQSAITYDREPWRIVRRMDAGLATLLAQATNPEQQWWEAAAQQVVVNVWLEHWGLAAGQPERDPETRFRPYFLRDRELPASSPRWAGIGRHAWATRGTPARQGQRVH